MWLGVQMLWFLPDLRLTLRPDQRRACLHLSVVLVLLVPVGHFWSSALSPLSFSLLPFPQRGPGWRTLSLLTDRARDWGTAEWQRQSLSCSSVQLFPEELLKVFDHSTPGREAAQGLLELKQGARPVSEYSIEFRTKAAGSRWNAASLLDAFYHGFSGRIKDELAVRDLLAGLEELVALSIRIDSRLWERRKERDFPAAL